MFGGGMGMMGLGGMGMFGGGMGLMGFNAIPGAAPPPVVGSSATVSRICCLENMVDKDELKRDSEFQEVLKDTAEECSKHGEIVKIWVPRPGCRGEQKKHIGRVFIVYTHEDDAIKCQLALNGRKFAGNTVVATFVEEDAFVKLAGPIEDETPIQPPEELAKPETVTDKDID
mmetsp:Transcript_41120/g.88890  ORF Transcript_41120/g.88890 Transcript_41120/m.88890 type:complete len:172 (+) Transcript_41120:3-518(+)